jgi:GNAT superfamily N-acetyltransferase
MDRSIRRAVPADASVVAGIQVRGWQWGYRGILPDEFLASLSVAERTAKWAAQLDPAYRPRTWLAQADGAPGAFVTCGPARDDDVSPTTGEVYALYQEERASGSGVARLLMAHALDDLRTEGFESAVLWVLERNPRARRFYEKGGWRQDGTTRIAQGRDGDRPEVRYHRLLMSESRGRSRYDGIGQGYAATRREDPRLRQLIVAALGSARTVVNVGAGAGSYEPSDRYVVAIEPSDVMAAQRPRHLAPALKAEAHRLPLRDGGVDAAMAILTVHHWDEEQERGVRELRRVATGPVVILTCDPEVSGAIWLMADYLPEVAELDRRIFPSMARLSAWLGGTTRVETVPIPRDTCDWTLMSFWAHPERVLDASARHATSGFARMPAAVVDRVVAAVSADLADGTWDARHGALRKLDAYDAGARLVVNVPA